MSTFVKGLWGEKAGGGGGAVSGGGGRGKADDPDGTHMAHSCHHSVGLVQTIGQDICYYFYLYSVELPVAYLCPFVV